MYLRSVMDDRKNRTTWSEEFRVRTYEADALGELRPDALFDYLQECAASHAEELGFSPGQMAGPGLAWVLSRLIVEIARMPQWKTTLKITTWPSSTQGIFATRDFRVTDQDGLPVAVATSAWFLIDTNRRRPARLPSAVTDIRLPEGPRALVDDFARAPPIGGGQPDRTLVVGASQVDMNQHVNHVRYAAWALDSMDPSFLSEHRLRRIQLQFRSESAAGDDIEIFREKTSDFSWSHSVYSAPGDLLAQAQTDWEPRIRPST